MQIFKVHKQDPYNGEWTECLQVFDTLADAVTDANCVFYRSNVRIVSYTVEMEFSAGPRAKVERPGTVLVKPKPVEEPFDPFKGFEL